MLRSFTLVLICLSLQLPAPHAGAEDDIGKRLTNKTITVTTLPHPKSNVLWGRAEGIVKAPFDRVMKIVNNYAGYADFLPHFEKSNVLSQRGTSALVYMEAKIIKRMVTVWAEMKLQAHNGKGKTRIVEGDMMKGNVDIMSARWEVTPLDDGTTLVAFQLIMDPGVPVPTSTINYFGAKATKQTIQALRLKLTGKKS